MHRGNVSQETHLNRDASVFSIIPKDANASAFAELGALKIEVLCHADILHQCPVLPCIAAVTELYTRFNIV